MAKINKEYFNIKNDLVKKQNERSVWKSNGEIGVGKKVEDLVSGLKGTSITRCIYLNGCIQHEVQPPIDENGKYQKAVWIDEGQLITDDFIEAGMSEYANIGYEVEDSVTGLKGITIAYAEHKGLKFEEYEVQPFIDNDGIRQESIWINKNRLEFIQENSYDDTDSSPPDQQLSSGTGGGHRNHPKK